MRPAKGVKLPVPTLTPSLWPKYPVSCSSPAEATWDLRPAGLLGSTNGLEPWVVVSALALVTEMPSGAFISVQEAELHALSDLVHPATACRASQPPENRSLG